MKRGLQFRQSEEKTMIIPFPLERVSPRTRGPGILYRMPRSADTLYERASRIDDDQPELTERLYREALRIDPAYALARTNLGNLLFKRGDREDARTEFVRAIMADPKQPEALYNLGYIFHEEGRDEVAVKYYEESLKHDCLFDDCWFNYGLCLSRLGKKKKAEFAFRKYLEHNPIGVWSDVARRRIEEMKQWA